jgi:hypothetical protein
VSRRGDRAHEAYVVVNHTRLRIDYTTTLQFGGWTGEPALPTKGDEPPRFPTLIACFFSVGAPGKCMHYVMNLPAEAEHLKGDELTRWIAKHFRLAQHITTCNVRSD